MSITSALVSALVAVSLFVLKEVLAWLHGRRAARHALQVYAILIAQTLTQEVPRSVGDYRARVLDAGTRVGMDQAAINFILVIDSSISFVESGSTNRAARERELAALRAAYKSFVASFWFPAFLPFPESNRHV